ncbi:hypothetical protein K505DRAFT_267399 [Melanomma pulvis-pyrius CBS 109.77]|uniref:Uncharacterized protein n=1 Tax=Melanomma pulvis-pyrius CBS 109.77 TaxID=1314802 RepID=A0A6A6XQQ0_9PLEO|nr:hypothetical protein K505DRAFT_267399 [Melanomma pulvis-pyrius CBS 109.77]
MDVLSEGEVLATFDKLVSEGSIIYQPYETISEDCEGYPLEFRICPSLAKKPHTVGTKLDSSFDKSQKWGPGSDMFCTDERLKVAKLNNSHDLALNLFCVDRPQFVVLTLDSYRRQHEPLDLDDFKAALEMVTSLSDMYLIFNCSEEAGCSRVHKHMQGLRGPPTAFEAFVGGDRERSAIPFQYFVHHFAQGFGKAEAKELLGVYEDLLRQTRGVLGKTVTDVCPHNVILWRDWIIVVPRRRAAVGSASANAAGMLGSIWVPDRSGVDEWLRLGGRSILKELGVPALENGNAR